MEKSFLTLVGCENGNTYVKPDLLIRKHEYLQAEIKKRDERISELEETVNQRTDIAKKCK